MRGTPKILAGLPAEVIQLVRDLGEAGFGSYLVGGSLRDLLASEPVRDFDVTTPARPEQVLELFPRAIPIGLRHGTVMVPTPVGPVDVTTFRGGPRIEDDLAHRDFTVNAIAFDPCAEKWIDPFNGREDLAAGRLRCAGDPAARLAEDSLRALRAARFLSTRALEPDAALRAALPAAAEGLREVPGERLRHELEPLLLGKGVEKGLRLLRETGLEAVLARGVRPQAAALVARLPHDLDTRLAGWLLGARATAALVRLRFRRRRIDRVTRLVELHPVEQAVEPDRDASVRRLMRRAGPENVGALIALREAELGVDPQLVASAASVETRLAALRVRLERVRQRGELALCRRDLALSGNEVMEALGSRPGPLVGQALHHLTERVIEDPACNTPERLRVLLREWWERESGQ